jgi:hypothetical protein
MAEVPVRRLSALSVEDYEPSHAVLIGARTKDSKRAAQEKAAADDRQKKAIAKEAKRKAQEERRKRIQGILNEIPNPRRPQKVAEHDAINAEHVPQDHSYDTHIEVSADELQALLQSGIPFDTAPTSIPDFSDPDRPIPIDEYVFSAGSGFISYIRTDVNSSVIPYGKEGTLTLLDARREIRSSYATKMGPSEADACGSYNCFFNAYMVASWELWEPFPERGALYAVVRLGVPMGQLPTRVSVRAPKRSNNDKFSESSPMTSRAELWNTLYMASLNLAPRVLAALPVRASRDGISYAADFAYVTETGWGSLRDLYRDLTDVHTSLEARRHALTSISDELVKLFRRTAEANVLLLDVKSANMVARKSASYTDDKPEYDLRMIDFGSDFSTNVAVRPFTATAGTEEVTSSDCVFFINTLLYLNFEHRYFNGRSTPGMSTEDTKKFVFKALAVDTVTRWYALKSDPTRLTGLCALLDKDLKYYPEAKFARFDESSHMYSLQPEYHVIKDLNSLNTVEEYNRAMRVHFYIMIKNYGLDTFFSPSRDPPAPNATTAYLDTLVSKLRTIFEVTDEDIAQPQFQG